MTCIIGLAKDGKVYIGGDSAACDGWEIQTIRIPKVFHCGEFIIGYTSSFRMGQILQCHLSIKPQEDESIDAYIMTTFVEVVRSTLKEYGFSKVENNQEAGGTFLVGYRGQLYEIQDEFSVLSYVDGIAACGCGKSYALGAMRALEMLLPRERIERSLKIAAYYSNGVRGPFVVLSGKGQDGQDDT